MPYRSFWGSSVQPQATPSETCLPHQLRITKAVLDPVQAAKLQPGTRVSVWATQKMRPTRSGALHPVEARKSLVATLVSTHRESVDTSLYFRNSTLLSFSISPQSHSCAVHLAGYFDHSPDAIPEQTDDGTITWAELQELMANARGQTSDGDEDGDADNVSSVIEEMRRQVSQAQSSAPDEDVEIPSASKRPPAAKEGVLGKRKSGGAEGAQGDGVDQNKRAALDKIRTEALENEAKFAKSSPIAKHSRAHSRKLAGGVRL